MTRAIVEAAVANDSQSGIGVAVKPGPDVAIGPVPPLSIDLKGGTTEKGTMKDTQSTVFQLGDLKVTSLKTTRSSFQDAAREGTKTCTCYTYCASCCQGSTQTCVMP